MASSTSTAPSGSTIAGVTTTVPAAATGTTTTATTGATTTTASPPTLASTGPALGTRYPASATSASRAELDVTLNVVSGALPNDLAGHSFVITSLPVGDGTPIFNGDGMVYRLDLGGPGPSVSLRSRIMKTPCWYADQAAAGTTDGFANFGFARMSLALGVRNEANTALLPFGNERLLVTYDAGRPYEIDPVSLRVVTPMGQSSEWRSGLPTVSFLPIPVIDAPFKLTNTSAHPFSDPRTGEVFTINYGLWYAFPSYTDVVRWDGTGALERWSLVLPNGDAVKLKQTAHQFAVTQDYIIVVDTAFKIDLLAILSGSLASAQSPDTQLYIIRRADLIAGATTVTATQVTLEREIIHLVADYDNPAGAITLHTAHNCASDPSDWLRKSDELANTQNPIRQELAGHLAGSMDVCVFGRYTIDATSGQVIDQQKFVDQEWTWGASLFTAREDTLPGTVGDMFWVSLGFYGDLLSQQVFDLYQSYPYRTVDTASFPAAGKPASIFRFDHVGMKVADGYHMPVGRIVLSPQFVPRPGSTGPLDGYVIATVLSDDQSNPQSSGDEFWIFDAANLAQGPLCRLAHPQLDMPFTLHTAYMPTISPNTGSYKIPIADDFGPLIANSSANVQAIFNNDVFPNFP